MSFKGGIYFLDFTGIDLEGAGEDLPGVYGALKAIKGKPIYVYTSLSGLGIEGLATVVWNDENSLISLSVSGLDPNTSVLMVITFDITDEAGISTITPSINVVTPDSD